MTRAVRVPLLIAALALAIVATAVAAAAAPAASSTTVKLNGVKTTLTTDTATTKVLVKNAIVPLPVRGTGFGIAFWPFGLKYAFPITDADPDLTAAVNGDPNVRVSILNLDLSQAQISKPLPFVKVNNVGAFLNQTAADALNASLGVSFFAPGIKLGTADVLARVAG